MPLLKNALANERNILFVTAHPDDSAVMLGGAIQLGVESLGSDHIFVSTATNGEAGQNHLAPGDEGFVKAGRRQEEERAALEFLGIQKEHIYFSQVPDGEVDKNRQQLSTDIAMLCHEHDISAIITLGPKNDGHTDHIATHEVALEITLKNDVIKLFALNGDHAGNYTLILTSAMASRKFAAASYHKSQYSTPGWLTKEDKEYTMGPKFSQASPFYPPLAKAETFDLMQQKPL